MFPPVPGVSGMPGIILAKPGDPSMGPSVPQRILPRNHSRASTPAYSAQPVEFKAVVVEVCTLEKIASSPAPITSSQVFEKSVSTKPQSGLASVKAPAITRAQKWLGHVGEFIGRFRNSLGVSFAYTFTPSDFRRGLAMSWTHTPTEARGTHILKIGSWVTCQHSFSFVAREKNGATELLLFGPAIFRKGRLNDQAAYEKARGSTCPKLLAVIKTEPTYHVHREVERTISSLLDQLQRHEKRIFLATPQGMAWERSRQEKPARAEINPPASAASQPAL